MIIEILGFLSGAMVIGVAGVLFLRHKSWKTIHSVYGERPVRETFRGNALIWPSH